MTRANPQAATAAFNRLCDARYGKILYNIHDMYVGRSFELYGEFSEGEVELFRQIARRGDLVMDIGANIGAHTVPLAQMVGPEGVVIAFEPQRLAHQLLCANVALNSLMNVHCLQCALGEAQGALRVPVLNPNATNNFGGLSIDGHSVGEHVAIRTVDAFAVKQCRLMKIDVEGMEENVLRGAVQTILRCRPILYVESDRQEKRVSLVTWIRSQNYRLFLHEPPLYNPQNFRKNLGNVFGRIVSKNLLCIPAEVKMNINGLREIA